MFPGVALLFWLFIRLAALVLGPLLLLRGIRRRAWSDAAAGAALLGALLLYAHWSYRTGVDQWNPYPIDPRAIVGTWRIGDSNLELRRDGSFSADVTGITAHRVGITQAEGTWTLRDWNLVLRAHGGQGSRLRVVVRRGEYRVIDQPEDLDGWTPWRGFSRTPPALAPR